jgi:hypothetical protein
MNPPAPDAAKFLKHARQARASGDLALCQELANAAFHMAYDAGDGTLCYRARACVGHAFYYRACFEEAYQWWYAALKEALAWDVRRWIGAAHHDCWLAYSETVAEDDAVSREHSAEMAEGWSPFPRLACHFVFNHAGIRYDRHPDRERAAFLASAALSASWNVVPPASAGAYAVYQAKLDRMIAYASQVQGYGGAGLLEQWQRAMNLFDMASHELGTYEAYAFALLACANGTWRLGERLTALSLLHRAMAVADQRGETEIIRLANRMRAGWDGSPPGS